MCGILGSINIINSEKYLDHIKHRGPDASGVESFKINFHTINLSHRRLAIVDLSEAGTQPMFAYDGKACITFNGEIYNHYDLKEKLGSIKFKGHSDTETILTYFRKFGIHNTLVDLNGIFGFAYLDLENELLHLARDRFGVKPLYYYFDNKQLLFSSEIRPLKALLDPEIDKGSLTNTLRMRYSPSPSTIYQRIHKVEPGQLLTFNLHADISISKHYYIEKLKSIGSYQGEYKKVVKEYGDLFENAVERQLMSDVEVGIMLSGGVDSALVAAIAKAKSKKVVKTFTVGFEDDHKDIDEINYAQQTAAILGLENFSKKIDFNDFQESINKITEIVEEPIGTTSIIPMFFLAGLASSKVKVVLSGQGADEPLGGYNKYKGIPWLNRSRWFRSFMPFIKKAEFAYGRNEKVRRMLAAMQCTDIIKSFVEFNAISSIKEIEKLINPLFRKSFIDALTEREELFYTTWKDRIPEKSNIKDLFLYLDLRTSLADDLLMYTDKITMHFSLECRVPILDNELINFIESLDSSYKFNSRKGKIIHKDFAREYLPSAIVERKKLGFKSPTEFWFKQNHYEIEKALTINKEFNEVFNIIEIKKLLTAHLKGRNLEKQIFLLLSISSLLQKRTTY